MTVSTEVNIPMGHRLMNHAGLCRHPHGHNYRVVISVTGIVHRDTGMLVDFSDLKKAAKAVLDPYDHAMVLHADDPLLSILMDQGNRDITGRLYAVSFHPTAEELASFWRDQIKGELMHALPNDRSLSISVTVYETPTSCAHAV